MSKALILAEITRILSSDKFFLTYQGKQEFLAELFLNSKQAGLGYYDDDFPTYSELTSQTAKKLAEENNIPLTVEYTDANIEDSSVAYYRISGLILGESVYRFSTKKFNDDLKAAEANPMIISHFLHVNSGGGDTWYLDVAWKTMMGLKKPSIALVERVGASAAVYLISPAKKIYAATPNEIVGSIGIMTSFLDFIPYYEAMGLKYIEEYANKSDLKNKKYNDLRKGKPEQYKKEELDPLQQQFEAAVRQARPKAGSLEEKHPLFRGETYATQAAVEFGLIDGQKELTEALNEAYQVGMKSFQKSNSALHYLNNNYK
ncbi:MAG: S49 family peptidase [Mangrovibacterium sp.]